MKKQFSKCLQRRKTPVLLSAICLWTAVSFSAPLSARAQTDSQSAAQPTAQKTPQPDVDDYLGKIADRVLLQLHKPKTPNLKSSWSLRIYEGGQFAYLRRTHESGSEQFDEDVRKTIERSGPFPKLPPGLGTTLPQEEFSTDGMNVRNGIDVEITITSADQGASCHCQLAPKTH